MITKRGIITAANMQNTVTVTVHRSVVHPLYKKSFRISKKFLADTNGQDVHVGDEVLITECKPLSKRKHFKVTDIVKQGPRVSDITEEEGLQEAMYRKKSTTSSSSLNSSMSSISSQP